MSFAHQLRLDANTCHAAQQPLSQNHERLDVKVKAKSLTVVCCRFPTTQAAFLLVQTMPIQYLTVTSHDSPARSDVEVVSKELGQITCKKLCLSKIVLFFQNGQANGVQSGDVQMSQCLRPWNASEGSVIINVMLILRLSRNFSSLSS